MVKSRILTCIYLFLALSVSLPLFCMDSKSQAIFSQRNKEVIKAIDATPKGGFVGLESPFFSDKGIVKSLSNAAQRGANVVVKLASRAKADQEKLENAGVRVKEVPGLHAKRCLISDYNPETKRQKLVGKENGPSNTSVYIGSDNWSFFSGFRPAETMVKTENDEDYFKQNYELFKSPVRANVKKKVLGTTPKIRKAIGSRDFELNKSKSERLGKLAENPGAGNSVDIASMTFDNDDVVSQLEHVYKKCGDDNRPKTRLILDRSALKHTDLLDRVKEAGGSDASIHIFNVDGSKRIFNKFPEIQHAKTITREHNGEQLSIVSTGNLANRSDTDLNIDSYHPGDKHLFDQIRNFNDTLVGQCTEYVSK